MGLSSWGLEPVRPGRLRLGSAFVLYRRRLRRRRWVQDLLAVLGIAAGVALLYATQVASTSLSGPVARLNNGIVGGGQLQIAARGATSMPEQSYNKIVALPGVLRAAPALQVPGNVVGSRGEADITFLGADPRIVKLRGDLLRGFSSADAARQETVIVPSSIAQRIGLRFGNDVRLQLAGRTVAVPAAVADRGQIGGLADTSIALVPLAYLQRLSGAGHRVSRILVEAQPGKVAQVRGELARLHLPGTDVRPSTYETDLFNKATMPTSAASTIFSVLSALVGWLFAVCALLVTASERRKLVTQQRRQGFPPSATLMTLAVDAAVIGVVGVAAGLAAGELISRQGFRADVSFLSGAFPVGDVRIVTWQCVAIAAVGGLLAAAIGVLAPVREVVAASLPTTMRAGARRAGTERVRSGALLNALGLVFLVAAIVVTVAVPGMAVVGLVLLGAALACLLPAILRTTIAALERVNRRGRSLPALELALHQLRAKRWRARGLAIATTGAIAVFGATALQGARANLQAGLNGVAQDLNQAADIWATAPGAGSSIGTTSFAPRDAARLRALPAVAGVSLYRAGLLDIAEQRAWVVGAPTDERTPVPASQILDGTAREAYPRLRSGGWATVSRALADDLHLRIGQRFILPAPHPLALRLAAVTTNLGWSAGAVVINAADFRRSWGSDAIAAYHVQLARGTSPAAGQRAVAAGLGSASALKVETGAQRAERQGAVARSGLSRLRQIAALTLIAAVLAMSAAMTGLLWQHRAAIASHKYLGLRTGLLWRSLLAETGVLFGVGAIAGALFGLLGQALCTRGVETVTGFPVAHELRLGTAIATAGAVLVASLLAVVIPGYAVARSLPSARE